MRPMPHVIATDQKQAWFEVAGAVAVTARTYLSGSEGALDGSDNPSA